MPRRTFVLLVLVILAGLWTPSQRITAQTECPEGGCKVFLPMVHTNRYLEITSWGVICDRSSANPRISVEVKNISQELVTGFQVDGYTIDEDGTFYDHEPVDFEATIYPGDTESVNFEPSVVDCLAERGAFHVTKVTLPHRVFYPLSVISRNYGGSCPDYEHSGAVGSWVVSGELRNDTPYRLTNLVLRLETFSEAVATAGTLEPGQTVQYEQEFSFPCVSDPDPPEIRLYAWGEYVSPVSNSLQE